MANAGVRSADACERRLEFAGLRRITLDRSGRFVQFKPRNSDTNGRVSPAAVGTGLFRRDR